MSENCKILSDAEFWDWMLGTEEQQSQKAYHGNYLKMIAQMVAPPDYIAHYGNFLKQHNNTDTISMLIQRVPRSYFLDLHYCITEYAKVFGTLFPDMLGNIGDLAYIEWLLYVEPEQSRYRDHLVHMFKVAYSCSVLLSFDELLSQMAEAQFSSNHFIKWCKKSGISTYKWSAENKKNIIEIALYLASIFHDFGYGHFYLNKYRYRLSNVCRWISPEADPVHTEHRDTQTLLKSLSSFLIKELHPQCYSQNSNNDIVLSGFYRDCLNLNHSVASAIFVIDLAEQLSNKNALTPELYVSFQIAAEAVLLHDMTKIGKWLHLKKTESGHFLSREKHSISPSAILLIIADELAGWGRPMLTHELQDSHCMKISMKGEDAPPSEITIKLEHNMTLCLNINANIPGMISSLKELNCLQSESPGDSDLKLLDIDLHFT